MRCDEKYFEWMNRSIDGDLDETEQARLEAHLAGCAECRALYAALQRMAEEARALEAEPSADLTGRIMSAVKAGAPRKTTGRPAKIMRWVVSVGGAAAILAMVLLTARLGTSLNQTKSTAPMDAAADMDSLAPEMADNASAEATGSYSFGSQEEQEYSGSNTARDDGTANGESASSAPEPMPMPGSADVAGQDAEKLFQKAEGYRYVLLFTSLPEALEDFSFETDDMGSRCYDVSNALAEQLMEEDCRFVENDSAATASLVIVEQGKN